MQVKSTLIRAALAAGLMAGLSVSVQAQKAAKPEKVADPNKVYRTEVRDTIKLENQREKRARSLAHRQSGHLLQKIKLTPDQKRQIRAIEKKYDAEYTNAEKMSHNSSVLSSILTSESQEARRDQGRPDASSAGDLRPERRELRQQVLTSRHSRNSRAESSGQDGGAFHWRSHPVGYRNP